jgi:DNA-binding FrmR family transcriptional regulator
VFAICDKDKLLHQIRRIGGQFGAIEGAIEQEGGCSYILQSIAAARGSLDSLLLKVIDEHIRVNVMEQTRAGDPERARSAEDVVKLVQMYLR